MPWRRKWQPTPVFLLGKPQGQKSMVGYRPQGHRVEQLSHWAHELTLFKRYFSQLFTPVYKLAFSFKLFIREASQPWCQYLRLFPNQEHIFLKKKKISKCDFVLTGEGFGIKQPWIPSTSHHMWIRNLASQTWSPLSEWKLGSDHLQWSLLQQDQH